VDAIGVVISKNEDGKFDVYRVIIADDEVLSLEQVKGGEGRAKRYAIRVAQQDFVAISQMFTRDQVEFGE